MLKTSPLSSLHVQYQIHLLSKVTIHVIVATWVHTKLPVQLSTHLSPDPARHNSLHTSTNCGAIIEVSATLFTGSSTHYCIPASTIESFSLNNLLYAHSLLHVVGILPYLRMRYYYDVVSSSCKTS